MIKSQHKVEIYFNEWFDTLFVQNGGTKRERFEHITTLIQKTPLKSIQSCINLYGALNPSFTARWEKILTKKQKIIYELDET